MKVGSDQQAANRGGKQGSYDSPPKPQHDGDHEIATNSNQKESIAGARKRYEAKLETREAKL